MPQTTLSHEWLQTLLKIALKPVIRLLSIPTPSQDPLSDSQTCSVLVALPLQRGLQRVGIQYCTVGVDQVTSVLVAD
jgi:hypothetical protein